MASNNFIGGMASPDSAREFTESNSPATSISCIAKDTAHGLRGIFDAIYNPVVRGPVHLVTKTARTAINGVFGMPWAVGHKSMKIMENVVDAPYKGSSASYSQAA